MPLPEKPLTETQRNNMKKNLLKHLTEDKPWIRHMRDESLFVNTDSKELHRLIIFFAAHQTEITHLVKWANINRRAFRELKPADLKDVQDWLKVYDIEKS